MVISTATKTVIAAISFFLLTPILFMNAQGAGALVDFHNRFLTEWPSFFRDRRTPSVYFDQVNRWLTDRAFPTIVMNDVRSGFSYYVLRQPPSPNISIGRDGLTFLNGTDAAHENNLVVNSCVNASDPAQQGRLRAALGRIAAFGRDRGYPIDVLIVPTMPVLYGDGLPLSLSSALRQACAASYARRGPAASLDAPAGMRLTYPFEAFRAVRDDRAMYPSGNYHASGLSVRIATNAYLRSIGVVPIPEDVTPITAPSEVLDGRGMQVPFPAYAAAEGDVEIDAAASASLSALTAPFRDDPGQVVTLYRDPTAPEPGTLLVLSDSFGTHQARDLSSAFRIVAQMQTPHRDLARMIDDLHAATGFDRLLLVFNDTNFGRLSEVGERLSISAGR